jgi:hypothetical protein
VPGRYGVVPRSPLLLNDGRGRFTDATARLAPELARAGLVTDAVWQDVDADRRPDLVVVGEWMPITVFRNAGGGRLTRTATRGLEHSRGWWNRVVATDVDGDGRMDFVVGNLGLNARLQATPSEPVRMYVKDFDGNGFVEQIVTTYSGGKSYPLTLRDDLIRALPPLKTRYLNYKNYARQTVTEVFSPAELQGAVVQTAEAFATSVARNNGDGSFTLVPLPREAQVAPVYGILAHDVDGDGVRDLVLAGNFDGVKTDIGRMHASRGLVLRGDPSRCRAQDRLCVPFAPMKAVESGFSVPGQARDIQRVRTTGSALLVVAQNNDRPLLFRVAPRTPPRVAGPLATVRPAKRRGPA